MKGGRKEGLRNSISEMEKKKEDDEDGERRTRADAGPLQNRPRRSHRRGSGGGRYGDRSGNFPRVSGLVAAFAFVAAFVSMSAGKQAAEGGKGGGTIEREKRPLNRGAAAQGRNEGEQGNLRRERNRHKLGEFAAVAASREASVDFVLFHPSTNGRTNLPSWNKWERGKRHSSMRN